MFFIRCITILCFTLNVFAQSKNENEILTCVRWKWSSNDTFNRHSVCIEWKKKDCSKRLYKEICKGGIA